MSKVPCFTSLSDFLKIRDVQKITKIQEEKLDQKYTLFTKHPNFTPVGEFNWKLFNLSKFGNVRVKGLTIDINWQIDTSKIFYFIT